MVQGQTCEAIQGYRESMSKRIQDPSLVLPSLSSLLSDLDHLSSQAIEDMIETAKGAANTMKRQEKKRQEKANKQAEEAKKAEADREWTAEEWDAWVKARMQTRTWLPACRLRRQRSSSEREPYE